MHLAELASDLRLALDPVTFAAEKLDITLDQWQAEVLTHPSKRIILNCSRQAGKSTVTSIMALIRALYYPKSLILLLSPSLRQSTELFRKVMDALKKLHARPKLTEDNKLSTQFDNGSRIISLPGKEGTIRGFSGASLLVIDEASRVDDSTYKAVRPMLATSGGRLVILSTPWGKRGFFHDEWVNGGETWQRFKITAHDVPRIPAPFLEEEQRALGEFFFAQEYLCEFRETVDQVFSYEMIMGAIDPNVKPLEF
ncbi:MAG: terminase large subunit [Candidatus Eremiobacteraeota bacterium]|nr:terminase large subunit [Candidatus Eremiobacteraeota bacterium]